jgi:uncharacterized delta-60 repeat protein
MKSSEDTPLGSALHFGCSFPVVLFQCERLLSTVNKLRLILLALQWLHALTVFCQAGELDISFGGNGVQATDLTSASDFWNDVAILSDGSIIVCGWPLPYVAKYHSGGAIDTSFGESGIVTIDVGVNAYTNAIAIQSDGRIVLAGQSANEGGYGDLTVFRLLPNGDLDPSFGNGGYVVTHIQSPNSSSIAHDVVIQPDGKIVAVGGAFGKSELCIMRYDTTGILDPFFDQDGIAEFPDLNAGTCVAIQADGRILAGGYSNVFGLVRVNSDGSPDPSFGGDGIVVTSFGGLVSVGQDMVVQNDGRIILAGYTAFFGPNYDFTLARYNGDGSLDITFGSNGKMVTGFTAGSYDVCYAVCLQTDGKVLLTGRTHADVSSIGIVRYNVDGSLDPSFGNGGKVATTLGVGGSTAYGIALQTDGKILVAGDSCSSATVLIRYLNDLSLGLLGMRPNDQRSFIYPNPLSDATTFQYSLANEQSLSLNILDATGRNVRTIFNNAKRAPGEHRETLDLSGLAAGNYTLVLVNNEGVVSVTVVKQ